MKTLATLALVPIAYVAVSVLTVEFLPRIGAVIFWPLTAACAAGLVWALARSQILTNLGWVRYALFLIPALAVTYLLFFTVVAIGMGLLKWEPM